MRRSNVSHCCSMPGGTGGLPAGGWLARAGMLPVLPISWLVLLVVYRFCSGLAWLASWRADSGLCHAVRCLVVRLTTGGVGHHVGGAHLSYTATSATLRMTDASTCLLWHCCHFSDIIRPSAGSSESPTLFLLNQRFMWHLNQWMYAELQLSQRTISYWNCRLTVHVQYWLYAASEKNISLFHWL